MLRFFKTSQDGYRQGRNTVVRYEARIGALERCALFAVGAGLLCFAFAFFQLRDFFVYFFLWPGVLLALWAMGYAVFGHSETWRLDDEVVVQRQRNCVGSVRHVWRYSDIGEVRIRAKIVDDGGRSRVEMRVGERWLELPEQVNRQVAERMLAEIVEKRGGD